MVSGPVRGRPPKWYFIVEPRWRLILDDIWDHGGERCVPYKRWARELGINEPRMNRYLLAMERTGIILIDRTTTYITGNPYGGNNRMPAVYRAVMTWEQWDRNKTAIFDEQRRQARNATVRKYRANRIARERLRAAVARVDIAEAMTVHDETGESPLADDELDGWLPREDAT